MITTDVIELQFQGDNATNIYQVGIEGIPIEPNGHKDLIVTVADGNGFVKRLEYGLGYTYTAKLVDGFSQYITVTLTDALKSTETLTVRRDTVIKSISEYPTDRTPSKQVELDFDNVIKILQEEDYDIEIYKDKLNNEIQNRITADQNLQDQIDNGAFLPKHSATHHSDGEDPLFPNDIGALQLPPKDGNPYLPVTTADGSSIWLKYLDTTGDISAAQVAQVFYFNANGKLSYPIIHTIGTEDVTVTVYDQVTKNEVGFGVQVVDKRIVNLLCDIPPEYGRGFKAIVHGPGYIDPAWMIINFVHDQTDPADSWVINHNLYNPYPHITVIDDDFNDINFSADLRHATENSITLHFANPVSGKAILSGWAKNDIGSIPDGTRFIVLQGDS